VPGSPALYHYVNESDTIVLHCTVKSYPKPTVTWEIPTDARYSLSETVLVDTDAFAEVQREWTITNANQADAGNYTCSADSTMEQGNTTMFLIVYCEYLSLLSFKSKRC